MRIMAVTKTVPVERILPILLKTNINLVGESRWQEAKKKLPLLPNTIERHFIGHLQSNKAKDVAAIFDCIETVDSLKLAETINRAAEQLNKTMPIFLQINISRDPAKHGFLPEQIEPAVAAVRRLSHLRLDGFMTITARQDQRQTAAEFAAMKKLQLHFGLAELSMGMSADWKLAEAAGATIVRLGTALFGKRPFQYFPN